MAQKQAYTDLDRSFMLRALEIARRGMGHVSPNPLVGCVIVDPTGSIIGEGAHLQFGAAHAEPNAIADAESKGHALEGTTVYVTLEPHSHQGNTPPCCDLLIEKKIACCVVAMEDPNPKVSGEGIRRMREAGIQVEVGLMETEAREQNRFFIKHITTGLPYVTLKLASSLDGRSALANGESRWITSEASRRMVHAMRAEHDAVLVGTRTALADDPALTVRLVEGRQPRRIVLDARLELPETLNLFTDEHRAQTIIVTTETSIINAVAKWEHFRKQGIQFVVIPADGNKLDLRAMFTQLGAMGLGSVLAEAGPALAASLVNQQLFDELQMFVAPVLFGGDAKPVIGSLDIKTLADVPHLNIISTTQIEGSDDTLFRLKSR
jgi:diaminohydroxyphosphoribosylaminopyrimidine deaminase/5-amino-6-(5-phosphoribosylamino)uracil reductase